MFWPFNSRGTITDDISWAQWLWRTCLEHRTSRSSSAIILVYVVHPAIYHNFDVVSLNLRAFIRHHHRPRQGINSLVLSACISPQSLQLASWMMIGYCVASTLVFLIVTTFQCHPIEFVWNKDLKGGKCVNYNAVAWANAAINIQQDILIFLLPVNALRRLQLNLK
jgi:hypothetical protein